MQTYLTDHYEQLTKNGAKREFIDKVRELTGAHENTVRVWVKGRGKTTDPDHLKALAKVSKLKVDKLFKPVL